MIKKYNIGFRFTNNKKEGVILQTWGNLPKHHKRDNEKGPFYGVSYDDGQYIWYNEDQLTLVIE